MHLKVCIKLNKKGGFPCCKKPTGKILRPNCNVRGHKAFKDEREDINDEQCAGCPSSS